MPTDLEKRFNEAMLDVYRRAKAEAYYNATRFLGMVTEWAATRPRGHSFIPPRCPRVTRPYGSVDGST